MNRQFQYRFALCIVALALVLLLLRTGRSKQDFNSGAEKDSPRSSQTRHSADQEDDRNALPLRERLSPQELSQIEPTDERSKLEQMMDQLDRDYNTTIDFWGQVIDQHGGPIAGVKAEMVVDEPAGDQPYVAFSDSQGNFELLGRTGARVSVKVSLDGYAPTANEEIGTDISSRMFDCAGRMMPFYAPPTRDKPQIFVLRKKNPLANLAHLENAQELVEPNGSPRKIERMAAEKSIGIEVRCWSSCPVPFTYDRYDWRAEIRIPDGKLQAIAELDPVSAPIDGYLDVFEIEMPKGYEGNWLRSSPNGTRNFWIQFDDGSYAKARIDVKTGRTHVVDSEIWYNLDGTNNFEQ